MLETIRRHQQSWLTYLIFVAIIVVFAVNFGPGSSSCQQGVGGTSFAASVDGDYIKLQDYQLAYSQQLEQLRRRAAASHFELTERMAEQMGLRQQVIDQLINERLLAKEALRRGLRVSDEELLDYLQKTYKVKDVSEEDYKSFVARNFGTTRQRFEDERRGELAAQKLAQVVTDNVAVSDDELKQEYLRDRDRAMISYVKLDLAAVKLTEPTQADIDKLVAAEPKALEERYQADAPRYRTPEERQGRMIFLKLAKDASDAEVARARSELQTIRDQVTGGADFGAVAKDKSQDDATKAKGGDLGLRRRGELAPAIDEALFTLKKDEISKDPVRTDDGMALVQVTTVKEPQPRPLDSVKSEVAASILRERAADDQLRGQADKLLAELKAGKKLDELTVSEDEKNKSADANDKKAAKPAADKPVRYDSAWIIKSQEAIPRIGVAPELQKEIFTLTKDRPVAPKAYKVNRAYYVVVLKDRETPDLAKFETEKESLRQQALWTKRTQVFQDWMKHLRTLADVQLNPALTSRPGRDQG